MPRGRKRKDYDSAVQKYLAGARIPDLAREYRMSRVGMYLILKTRGVEFRDDKSKINIDEAVELYNNNVLMKDLAEKYGVSVSAISLAFKKRGVPTRRLNVPSLEVKEAKTVFEQDLKIETQNIFEDLKKAAPDLKLSMDLYGDDEEEDEVAVFGYSGTY